MEEIGDWIAVDNPARARTFVDDLLERAVSLTRNPRRFPAVPGSYGGSVRKLSWHGYVILYRIGDDAVEIVRIVHGSRDWKALLTGE